MTRARAVAHSNIALAKYWGKADVEENLPAVPSLSMTLDALRTATEVRFEGDAAADTVVLDGEPASGRPRQRVIELLDRVRALAGTEQRAFVESTNDFPTAAGLASSASGFAALALAATAAAGVVIDSEGVSALARRSSASAARSIYGGFVSLAAGGRAAERVAPGDHFPLRMLVAVTASGPKSIGSTEAMKRTAETSPYYPAWVEGAPTVYQRVRAAVLERDFDALGEAMEQSTLMMHASMHAATPAVMYWTPATVAAMARVRALRSDGVDAYFTIDGGPHVKVLTPPTSADEVSRALAEVDGVRQVIDCCAGGDARVTT